MEIFGLHGRLPGRGVAEGLGAKEEASLGDDLVAGAESAQDRVGVTDQRPQPDRPLDELAVLALCWHENHLAISDGLDGRARHNDGAGAGAGRREAERHVHAQPEPAVRVRDLGRSAWDAISALLWR